jgi:hypothetical protein
MRSQGAIINCLVVLLVSSGRSSLNFLTEVDGFVAPCSSLADIATSSSYIRRHEVQQTRVRWCQFLVGLHALSGSDQAVNEAAAAAAASINTLQSGQRRNNNDYTTMWDVYVSQLPLPQSNKNKEQRGGVIPTTSDIIQTFISLAPMSETITAHPVIFQNNNKQQQKGKGHTVRCVQRTSTTGEMISALEVTNVDSVDKVYRIMTEHMKLNGINIKICDCMTLYIEANRYLEEGEINLAITMYDQALATAATISGGLMNTSSSSSSSTSQPQLPLRGSILMKRARAYQRRATNHRLILRSLVKDLSDTSPPIKSIMMLYQSTMANSQLSSSIFTRIASDSKVQSAKFKQVKYRHDMYEFALLHAVQDSLESTQLLSHNVNSWLLAGECLAELRKLKESNMYYQRALEIDPSMKEKLESVMEKNRCSQEFMDTARTSGFSGDTLRLAIDVAA